MAVVLVVDDDPTIRRVIREALERLGHAHYAVPDGNDALTRARLERFDAVLVDLKLVGENGLAVIRNLRGVQPDIPAVLVTGFSDLEVSIGEFARAQPFQFLAKLFTDDVLDRAIKIALARHRADFEVADAAPVAMERLSRVIIAFLFSPERCALGGRALPKESGGVALSTFRRWCEAADLPPHSILSFARLLRAIRLARQHGTAVIEWMDIDPRTYEGLVSQAGLGALLETGCPSPKAFIDQQSLVSNPSFLSCLQRLLRTSLDTNR